MKCINPIRMKNPQYPDESGLRYIDCACGKCYNCMVNRRRSWFFRLSCHALYNDGLSYFVSLDYAPSYNDKCLHKSHLQKYIKRFRHYAKFKYYAICEFGTKKGGNHNPHYHLLMFFEQPLTADYVRMISEYCWLFGRTDVGYVDPASINYVLHYHIRPKNPFGEEDERKTFCVMSQGLGLPFLDNNLSYILRMLTTSSSRRITNQDGDSFILPRYYVKRFQDLGVPVRQVDPDTIDYSRFNMREIIEKIDSSIQFEHDGRVKREYEDRFNALMFDIIRESKRKLDNYNHQEKF